MLRAKDFSLASCQATVFTPEEEVSGAKLVRGLLPRWSKHFDADPMILPVPDGISRDVPKLVLESKHKQWRCEIASARVNLFWKKTKAEPQAPTLPDFFAEASRLLGEYVQFQGARVGRLAAVLMRFAELPKPGAFLCKHFCRDRWVDELLNDLSGFEFHVHKRVSLSERFSANLWTRNKTGTITSGEKLRDIVFVEQDLNTLADEIDKADFSQKDIESFYSLAARELEAALESFYPVE